MDFTFDDINSDEWEEAMGEALEPTVDAMADATQEVALDIAQTALEVVEAIDKVVNGPF